VSTATTLLLNVAVGFLAAALVAPAGETRRPEPVHDDLEPHDHDDDDSSSAQLDDFMMEKSQ
jgi:hypothetical protein